MRDDESTHGPSWRVVVGSFGEGIGKDQSLQSRRKRG